MNNKYAAAWLQTWVRQNIINNTSLHLAHGEEAVNRLRLETWESDQVAGAYLISNSHYAEVTLWREGKPANLVRVEIVKLDGADGAVIQDRTFDLDDEWGLYGFWKELTSLLTLDIEAKAKAA